MDLIQRETAPGTDRAPGIRVPGFWRCGLWDEACGRQAQILAPGRGLGAERGYWLRDGAWETGRRYWLRDGAWETGADTGSGTGLGRQGTDIGSGAGLGSRAPIPARGVKIRLVSLDYWA